MAGIKLGQFYQVMSHAWYPILIIASLLATMPKQSASTGDAVVELDETDNITDSNDTGKGA